MLFGERMLIRENIGVYYVLSFEFFFSESRWFELG